MSCTYIETNQNNVSSTKKHQPTRTQLRLLEYIDQAGNDGLCRSKKALAHDLSCSTETIDRGVAHLCLLGLIEVIPNYLPTGGQTANVYRVCKCARTDVDWYCLAAEAEGLAKPNKGAD